MRATELGKTGNPLNKSNIQVNFIEKLKKNDERLKIRI